MYILLADDELASCPEHDPQILTARILPSYTDKAARSDLHLMDDKILNPELGTVTNKIKIPGKLFQRNHFLLMIYIQEILYL